MRPIEFRAWDKKEKRMIYFDLSELFYGDEIDGLTDTYANYVFMQYTGLQDKNGKKIFEGDIVEWFLFKKDGVPDKELLYSSKVNARCKRYIRMVKFVIEKSTFYPFCWYAHNYPFGTHGYDHKGEEVEVIGNKFENLELLEA